MSAKSGLRLAAGPDELSFGPLGELRETFATSGRVHIDRWLAFIVLHCSEDPEHSLARQVAINSPSYLIWSPDDRAEAEAALDIVAERLRRHFGSVLLIELRDTPVESRPEGSPKLVDFEVEIGGSAGTNAKAALKALEDSVETLTVNLRRPKVSVGPSPDPLLALDGSFERLSVTIPQIHRGPGGLLYPHVAHELESGLIDAILSASAAFIGSLTGETPPHFRSLGRSAFLAAALKADRKLDSLARSFDFLLSISPINSAQAKKRFLDQGEVVEPDFRYRPLTVDPDLVKRDLYAIDLSAIEDLLLERLLREKRREIDMQLTMLAARNTPAFRPASMLLYGAVGSELLQSAHHILATVKPRSSESRIVDCQQIAAAAGKLVAHYRSIDSRFEAKIEVRDDVSGLLVSGDKLLISSDSHIATNRLDPLLSHEVSVHLLTYFNGATQGLTIFRTGLAHYEGIQEGLGVFAEWAVGGLTVARLRLIAGRVVAVDAMIDGASFVDVYRRLRDDFDFSRGSAFDISARVFRSGGLAKDAIYLKGFLDVIERVATGRSLDSFWLGKIAPDHVGAVEELLQRGLLHEPVFVPEFLGREASRERIERLRGGTSFDRLLNLE